MRTLRRSVVILLGIGFAASALTAQGLYPEAPPTFDAGELAEHLAGEEPFHGSMPNGEITLTFLVDTTGTVHDVTSQTSVSLFSHTVIDDQLAGFRMTPATWRGRPVEVEWSVHLRFLGEETDQGRWQHVWIEGEKFSFPPLDDVDDGDYIMESFSPRVSVPTESATVDTADLAERIVRAYLTHDYHHPSPARLTARLVVNPDSTHGPPVSIRLDAPSPDSTLWVNVLYDALQGVRTTAGMLRGSPTRSILELPVVIAVTGESGETERIGVTIGGKEYTSRVDRHSPPDAELSIDISFPNNEGRSPTRTDESIEGRGDSTSVTFNPEELGRYVVYPEIARANSLEGRVIMLVDVDAEGTVTSLRVLQSDNPIFHASAMDAVRSITFRPATIDGRPVAGQTTVRVDFRLD